MSFSYTVEDRGEQKARASTADHPRAFIIEGGREPSSTSTRSAYEQVDRSRHRSKLRFRHRLSCAIRRAEEGAGPQGNSGSRHRAEERPEEGSKERWLRRGEEGRCRDQ